MTKEEKYYIRCYTIIKELENIFPCALTEDKMVEFIYQKSIETITKEEVVKEQQISLITTVLISLMGLNKEEIEKEFNLKYKRNLIDLDILKFISDCEKQELECLRKYHSDFDNWLFVSKNLTNKTTNYDYIKMVRNAFLHSEFKIDFSSEFNLINIKNKSFFEANLIYNNFYQFVTLYFGNNIGSGMTTNNMLFIVDTSKKIDDLKNLKSYLSDLEVVNLVLNNSDNEFYDYILTKNWRLGCVFDYQTLLSLDGKIRSFNKIKLTNQQIDIVCNYITNYYGENFYKNDNDIKQKYVIQFCNLLFNSKRYISSWILYIFEMTLRIQFKEIYSLEIQKYDYCQEGFFIALILIKAYLILYRLQSNDFIEIEYDKLDININRIELISNEPNDFFRNYRDLDNLENTKITTLKIFRNALSHGNINFFITRDADGYYFPIIEFVDDYKKSVRKLRMSLDELNNFLNSEAFLPKYCYDKEKQKKL